MSAGEKKYISPYKGRAHVIIDSSLRYEVPVFAHYADALRAAVEQVPPTTSAGRSTTIWWTPSGILSRWIPPWWPPTPCCGSSSAGSYHY